jgi:NADH-quinone oxidoreductase subunit L
VEKKYYVDELYDAVIVQPIRRGSESIWRRFDVLVIDGIVNGLGSLTLRMSNFVRRAQTGVIQNYAAVILLGVILIIFYVYLK